MFAFDSGKMDTIKNKFLALSVQDLLLCIICCSSVYLVRFRNSYTISPVWRINIASEFYDNGKYPFKHEYVIPPVITDLESDGVNEILLLTNDMKLQALIVPTYEHTDRIHLPELHIKYSTYIETTQQSDGKKNVPIALETGFIHELDTNKARKQIVVVVFDNWEVFCFDSTLKLLWSKQLMTINESREAYVAKSMGILIAPVKLDKNDVGIVLVGGGFEHAGHNAGKRPLMEKRPLMHQAGERVYHEVDDALTHFSTFALSGDNGTIKWQHLLGDFETHKNVESPYHWKLSLHRSTVHVGESAWTNYGKNILKHFPHRWSTLSDTRFDLDRLTKEHQDANDDQGSASFLLDNVLATQHIAGQAYGGQVPHSRHEHITAPNAVIIHSHTGIEVLNLQTGRPMTKLKVPTQKAAYADINNDGNIEKVATLYKDTCQTEVTTVLPRAQKIFEPVVCSTPSFWSSVSFSAAMSSVDSAPVEEVKPVLPLLIKSIGVKKGAINHLMGYRLASERSGYDSIFLTSTGRLTSYGADGYLQWQVITSATWYDQANKLSADIYYPEQDVFRDVFMPSMVPMSLQIYDKKTSALISGWDKVAIVDLTDGFELGTHSLPCQSILPPTVGDFNGDGGNDFIAVCSDYYVGFSIEKQMNLLHSGVVGATVVLIILLLAFMFHPVPYDDDEVSYAVD